MRVPSPCLPSSHSPFMSPNCHFVSVSEIAPVTSRGGSMDGGERFNGEEGNVASLRVFSEVLFNLRAPIRDET